MADIVTKSDINAFITRQDILVEIGNWPQDPLPTGATNTTVLVITKDSPSGTSFFTNSSGTHYTKEGDDGDLGITEPDFHNEKIQFFLNGLNLIKADHLVWTSRYSFNFLFEVSEEDWIKILS